MYGIFSKVYRICFRIHDVMRKILLSLTALASLTMASFASAPYWIKEVEGSGNIIVLNTGAVLIVDPIDCVTSAMWLPVDGIRIFNGENPAYPYLLLNVDEHGETVNAKLPNR
jgi:hypothetical protein